MRLSERLSILHPSITLEIDALGKKLKQEGKPVISFGAGELDFSPPETVLTAAKVAIDDVVNSRYSPTAGLYELRAKIAERVNNTQQLNGTPAEVSAEQVIVTNGGKQAIFEILAAILNPDDEIILLGPSWLTYYAVAEYHGAKVINIPGTAQNSYKVTPEELAKTISEKTRAVIINSPCNPTGAVYSIDELRRIGEVLLNTDVWIIADEIYESLIYGEIASEKNTAPHILEALPELAEQTILVNGVSKSYAMTGWRVGYLVAPFWVAVEIQKLQGHLTSNINNIAQKAALAALETSSEYFDNARKTLQERRNLMVSLLGQIRLAGDAEKGVSFNIPDGAFYILVNIENLLNVPLSGEKLVVKDAVSLAKLLLEKTLVAVVPMDSFKIANHIRFSYALSKEDITEGINRIIKFIGEQ
ncbi:MAG: pyridoxal phosphate-dependent aminotransferase [Candidatus Ancillula sp.]|nr:pyridoxal phosphate-dependent aminotransferase [Candidatus Ancillula sp.]